ncbi:hypothetical protein COEREDRAFT_85324 [Coemansia reversa NRRL 1564]|uniref:Uncharacterized protein n=1 Tax=Coemansia reversa (strain ATCC 12441 / NRRL 1564) TaxID=763665 RepID=A0A2G5BH54_COERN|nr:hypothetical protein COEREDRAFT_85324 [Coemansia reversa NRRL 1564]|eukprot:PIA18346.1 hypothetical protein COEREDRAFT_85324 [Coemansia reversa NRRL 1564]
MPPSHANAARAFSSALFIFAGAVYCYMLAYVIIVLPKTLMSIAMGITQFIMVLCCILSFFILYPGPNRELVVTMLIRAKEMSEQWLAMALHISIAMMIISDPLFLKEKKPKAGSPPVSQALYELMIAGAASQAAGVLVAIVAQAKFTDPA